MKKLICLILVLTTAICCLSSCEFLEKILGSMEKKAEAPAKIDEMMTAIAENNVAAAIALLHPDVAQGAESGFERLCEYVDGRTVTEKKLQGISIDTRTEFGSSVTEREEQLTYKLTMNDGEVIELSVVYVSNEDGSGFYSFQISFGTE